MGSGWEKEDIIVLRVVLYICLNGGAYDATHAVVGQAMKSFLFYKTSG